MTSTGLQGRRILVVEDEYLIADAMQVRLEAEGAVVLGPVPSVVKALRLLATNPLPDLAVLDINLGTEKVYPVAEALQERGVPFLFTTGYSAGDVPNDWRHVQRLEKPVEFHAVTRALREARTS